LPIYFHVTKSKISVFCLRFSAMDAQATQSSATKNHEIPSKSTA
jgi:hypothetical protein